MTIVTRIRRRLGVLRRRWTAAPPPVRGGGGIDLNAPEIARDPFPHYDALRAAGPVQFLARHGAWLVLGHEEVQQAFLRAEELSNRPYEDVDAVLLAADPPEHPVVRRKLNSYFGREVIERLGAFAAARAALLLRERMDVVADYARPLSESVAAELLGFDDAAVDAIRGTAAAATDFTALARGLDALAGRAALFARLRDDGFDDAQSRSLVRLFWVASTATTERVIAECVLALLQGPSVHEALTNDPALLTPFIEEVMRMHQPEPMLRRLATRDVELGGVRIPAGSMVYLSLAAANRDPRRYERPNELRLDRGAARHLTFGHGIHHCLGAPLARLEGRIGLGMLLERFPDLALAVDPADLTYRPNFLFHGLTTLPVLLGKPA